MYVCMHAHMNAINVIVLYVISKPFSSRLRTQELTYHMEEYHV